MTVITRQTGITLLLSLVMAQTQSPYSHVSAFAVSNPMFTKQTTMQKTTPSKTDGVEIELPNFEELFKRIREVSPLASVAIDGDCNGVSGFETADAKYKTNLKWKNVNKNKRNTVFQIDKIDNYQGLGCPIVRFRSTIQGSCVGELFAEFIMNVDERSKWDPQINMVDEIYPIYDVDAANIAMNFQYGDCKRLGIGFCQTKSNPIVDGREQLILCGIQDFPDKSCVIWGTELEEWHNHLMPDIERHTRAKSHLFATTLVPNGPDSFDVEYILQLEVGGKIPSFLTTPILVETVRSMFNHAKKTFADEEIMTPWLEREINEQLVIDERLSLLMTP
jgi:hypothetical protein